MKTNNCPKCDFEFYTFDKDGKHPEECINCNLEGWREYREDRRIQLTEADYNEE